jgi:hypothetical protein
MLFWILALAVGGLATYFAYPVDSRGVLSRGAAVARFVGVTCVVALALNVIVGASRRVAPLVALDASSSWLRGRDSTVFLEARRAALAETGDSVLAFGDSVRRADGSLSATDNASSLRAIAERAIATGRPLIVYTDGELDDASVLDGVPQGSRVVLGDTIVKPDAAIAEVLAPRLTAAGDTVEVRITVVASSRGAGSGRVGLTLNGREITGARLDSIAPSGERVLTMRFVAQGTNGDAELRATVESAGDDEPSNNSGAAVMQVASSAAAVLVSTSPDLDSRELAAVLRGTVALPTRAYFRVAPSVWREDGSLAPVTEEFVKRAIRDAPLVVLHGDTGLFGPPRAATRGALALVAPPVGDPGEWFATGAPLSPVAPALTGISWDSLPPLEVSAQLPAGAEFEILETRRARRMERRVAIVGWERPRRVIVAGASGFWRWRFRGGVGSDAYAAVWGSALDWLSGAHSDERRAVPATAAIRAGSAVKWRRGGEADTVVPVSILKRGESERTEVQLRFGSNTTTESPPLAEGTYEVTTTGGKSLLIVNPSSELVPRRPTARAGDYGSVAAAGAAPRARDWSWIFGLALVAFCAEWILRRRAGLR